jgi:hypothetical protein
MAFIMYQTPASPPVKQHSVFLNGLSVLLLALGVGGGEAIAQPYPACEPPATGEYLLLVISQSEQTSAQLQRTLPPNASTTVCQYLDNLVTRVGGFTDPEVANSWANYLTDLGGMQAFVARSPEAISTQAQSPTIDSTISPTIQPVSTEASTGLLTYGPQPLEAGYAVLVDYFNRPEVSTSLQQALGSQVGLVSYGQRPYLLALHTSDLAVANSVLQQLSDRNFLALVVDSRRAVLLTPEVALVE